MAMAIVRATAVALLQTRLDLLEFLAAMPGKSNYPIDSASGRRIDLADPGSYDISVEDIAGAS